MDINKSRKIVLDIVSPFFFKKGFRLFSEQHLNDMFYFDNYLGQASYGFYFKHSGWHTFFKAGVSIKVVENILNEAFERERFSSVVKVSTVFDNKTITGYEPDLTTTSKRIETELDARNMADETIEYIENVGSPFIARYSYLPNILKEINELMSDGKYWHQGTIGLDSTYFTGLIISKLCNDPEYNKKFEYVESLYFPPENKLTAYLPYLEKLKERLKTVEPIYNV